MAIGVKVMKRPEKQVSYVRATLKGMVLTFKHMLEKKVTMQYPEQKSTDREHGLGTYSLSPRWRGTHRMLTDEQGRSKCVACGLCEFACPTDCITIVPGELEGAGIERYPEEFDIDMSRCMFCGLCEEACPEEAIVMSREVELTTYERSGLTFQKEQLLVPEKLLERRLQFLRSEYDRESAPARREEA